MLNRQQTGAINYGVMTMLVAGLALAGLLFYGWQTGQELPVWPALAVMLVNVVAAGKLFLDAQRARKAQMISPSESRTQP